MDITLSGLIIGADDLLVVKMPRGTSYEETNFTAEQLRETLGERFILFKSNVELGAIKKNDIKHAMEHNRIIAIKRSRNQ